MLLDLISVVPSQARNQDFMWGSANEAKVDQTNEMYFLLSDLFIWEMYFPSLCLENFYFDGLECLRIAALD